MGLIVGFDFSQLGHVGVELGGYSTRFRHRFTAGQSDLSRDRAQVIVELAEIDHHIRIGFGGHLLELLLRLSEGVVPDRDDVPVAEIIHRPPVVERGRQRVHQVLKDEPVVHSLTGH